MNSPIDFYPFQVEGEHLPTFFEKGCARDMRKSRMSLQIWYKKRNGECAFVSKKEKRRLSLSWSRIEWSSLTNCREERRRGRDPWRVGWWKEGIKELKRERAGLVLGGGREKVAQNAVARKQVAGTPYGIDYLLLYFHWNYAPLHSFSLPLFLVNPIYSCHSFIFMGFFFLVLHPMTWVQTNLDRALHNSFWRWHF